MGEVIKGSKSSRYIKENIPGINDSSDKIEHVSVQNLWESRGALDTLNHGLCQSHTIAKTIGAGSVKRKLEITAHGAKINDFVKFNTGNSEFEEVAIVKIIDADFLIIAKEVDAAVGDEVFILKPVTPTFAKDGSVITSQGPVQFVRDAVNQQVIENTTIPANNRPLPQGLYIKKDDGNWHPVTLDQNSPFAHTPIPVAITNVLGESNVNVDLAGSTLNISIKHNSVDPSSVMVGNGVSGVGAKVVSIEDNSTTSSIKEMKVHDIDANTSLNNIESYTKTLNDNTITEGDAKGTKGLMIAGSDGTNAQFLKTVLGQLQVDVVSSGLPSGASTSANQTNGSQVSQLKSSTKGTSVSAGVTSRNINLDIEALDVNITNTSLTVAGVVSVSSSALPSGAATALNQTNAEARIANIESGVGAPADTVATADTGSFSIISFLKRGMENWTTLLGRLPPALNAQTATNSFSVVQASSHSFKTIEQARGAGTIVNIQKTVGLTEVRATVSGAVPSSRRKLIMKPSKNNTGSIFYGATGVTTANGLEIIGPDTVTFTNESDDYYLISDTAGQVVEILEVY